MSSMARTLDSQNLIITSRGYLYQVYANPDDSLSLFIGWNPPTETNGAEILSYIVELVSSSAGWSTPYFNVTLSVEDAAEMASIVSVGGKLSAVSTPLSCNCAHSVLKEPGGKTMRPFCVWLSLGFCIFSRP